MRPEQIILLLPLIVVSATAVLTMLMIAVKRSHAGSCLITALGLVAALLSLFAVVPALPQQVTPLFIVDSFSIFFTGMILLTALCITLFSYSYLSNLEEPQGEFYLLLSIATLGALIMAGSNHFITVFLGIETLSISLYGMIAYPLHRPVAAQYPLEASIKYLVLSAVSSGFILFGLALLYAETGSLAFEFLPETATEAVGSAHGVAAVMVLAGFAFKLSLVPFHLWTPDVYEGAPLPATAFLATIGKLAMVALLLRFMHETGVLNKPEVSTVMGVLAAASIVIGNLLALLQGNLKRLLAYSSIAHMGYLLIALLATSFPGSLGIEAAMFYLTAYVITTLAAFGVMIVVSDSGHERDLLEDYRGLYWRSPWLAVVLMAVLLSLAGIPLTIGFISKFYVFLVGVENELWILLTALVIGSGIGLYYYLRIVYQMLMPVAASEEASAGPVDRIMDFPETGPRHVIPHALLLVLLLGVIGLGVLPGPLMDLLTSIAESFAA